MYNGEYVYDKMCNEFEFDCGRHDDDVMSL